MSKNDRHKVDYSVHCGSDLSGLDLQSWNERNEEGGKYLLANLLEIRLSFQHYRCATLANYFAESLGPSSPQSAVLNSEHKSHSKDYFSLAQSLPTSPHDEATTICETSKLLPRSKSSSKQAIRFSSKDFHVLLSKFARFKRLNLESAGSKLSCLQSRAHKKRTKRLELSPNSSSEQLFDDLNEELPTESKPIIFPPRLALRKSVYSSGPERGVCEGPTVSGGLASPSQASPLQHQRRDSSWLSREGTQTPLGGCPNHVDALPRGSKPNVKHQVKSQLSYIPNTQPDHSCSVSFSNIFSPSLPGGVTHSTQATNSTCCKPSQLDFRSISEYGFTQSILSEHIKADVCSLPTCMDNEMGSHMLENNFSGSQHRIPSYVSISRAISGYADYNKYSSGLKRDSSLLDNFLLVSRVSPGPSDTSAQISKQTIIDDQVDNFCSLPYEPSHDKICLTDPSKSFLQKKIESLYGESFAEDWRKSRSKTGSPRSSSSAEKTRSPSCPPSRIANDEVNQLVKSFHKINSLDISSGSSGLTRSSLNESSDSLQLSSSINIASSSSTPDAKWFLNQLVLCTNELQHHIERYEIVLSSSNTIPDESVGKIRATIGKGNLLISKKMNQFNQLCQDSIAQREDQEFQIKTDDLRGFWDMVLIQVDEVKNAFDLLDKWKQNDWQPPGDEEAQFASKRISNPKHNISSPRFSKRASPKNSPKTASPNGLERENERKSRLMEIKRKGKLKTRDNAEEEITIFVPTADLDCDR